MPRRRSYRDAPDTALAPRTRIRLVTVGTGLAVVGGGIIIAWLITPDNFPVKNQLRTWTIDLGNVVGYYPDPTSRASTYWPQIQQASSTTGTPTNIIAGIGDRETLWGLSSALSQPGPAGTGDKGNGMGLMQIDQRYNPLTNWQDPQTNITAGASIYADYYNQLQTAGVDPSILARAAASAYNAGVSRVLGAINSGADPDSVTTGGNYGADVVGRASKFSLS